MLGITYDTFTSSNNSKGSRESKRLHVVRIDSNRSNYNRTATKTEIRTVKFLTRSLNMGVWLGLSLLSFLVSTSIYLNVIYTFDDNTTYRSSTIISLFQDVGIGFSLYQMLWFLEDGFRKTLAKLVTNRSKLDSKDVHASKELFPSKEPFVGSHEQGIVATTKIRDEPKPLSDQIIQ